MSLSFKVWALAAALAACCGAHLFGSPRADARRPQEERKESKPVSPEQLARAKALFNEKCARCHGADGRGETVVGRMLSVPDFTDEEWWKKEARDERFVESITEGKDEMPAFGKKLSRSEIRSLVAYVRRFGKPAH
ncbi:MAG TPA: cytochrome c [Pyrinomonadaceae bacterium]|nr:cytochrome c [Pyrinomonadaceae bacterium]